MNDRLLCFRASFLGLLGLAVLLLAPAQGEADSRFEAANADYEEAKKLMAKWDKTQAPQIIFLLTRARTDYTAVEDITPTEEKKLIEISQALYWQIKMKPANTKPFKGSPRKPLPAKPATKEEKVGPGENPEAGERKPAPEVKTNEESGTQAAGGEKPAKAAAGEKPATGSGKTKDNAAPGQVPEAKLAEPKKEGRVLPKDMPSPLPAAYEQALRFAEKHPDDLENQYLFFGQVLEEVDHEAVVRQVLGNMDVLRNQIHDRRELHEERWLREVPGLDAALRDKDFEKAAAALQRYKDSAAFSALDEAGRRYFKRLSGRVVAFDLCKKKLLGHPFRESLSAKGLSAGFDGNLVSANPAQLTGYDKNREQQVTLSWQSVVPARMAETAAPLFDENNPEDLWRKALALKAADKVDQAYDLLWKLMRVASDKAKVSEAMQDCELTYLEQRGQPIEELLQSIHSALEQGDRKQASANMLRIRRLLDHPLLSIYNHQLNLMKRKYEL